MQYHITVEKYQYKLPAMFFFSFKEILFLDADEFPLNNLEILFTSESFTILRDISTEASRPKIYADIPQNESISEPFFSAHITISGNPGCCRRGRQRDLPCCC